MARRRRGSRSKRQQAPRRDESYWRQVVAELLASDETTAEFADRRDLNRNTLSWWRWRLRDELADLEPAPTAEFLPVRVIPDPAPGSSGIEITLANGRRVHVSDGFSPELLARVVVTLEQLP